MIRFFAADDDGLVLAAALSELLSLRETEIVLTCRAGVRHIQEVLRNYRTMRSPCRGESLATELMIRQDGRGRSLITLRRELMMTPAQRMYLMDALHREAEGICRPGMSQRARVSAVARWVARRMRYRDTGRALDHNPFAGFLAGQGVCQSIALITRYMLLSVGIPARFISGRRRDAAPGDPGHAWNVVKVDGVWYHLDCTPYVGMVGLFSAPPLMTYEERRRDYTWDTAAYAPAVNDLAAEGEGSFPFRQMVFAGEKDLYIDGIRMRCDTPCMLVRDGVPLLWADLMAQLTDSMCEQREGSFLFRGPGGEASFPLDGRAALLQNGRVYVPAAALLPLSGAAADTGGDRLRALFPRFRPRLDVPDGTGYHGKKRRNCHESSRTGRHSHPPQRTSLSSRAPR